MTALDEASLRKNVYGMASQSQRGQAERSSPVEGRALNTLAND